MIKKEIDVNAPLTEAQKTMLKNTAVKAIVFDEDSPELTSDELSEFKRVHLKNNEKNIIS